MTPGGGAEARRQLAADAESPAGPRGGPHHGLVEDRGDNAAVDDAFESDVLEPRGELDSDDLRRGIDVQVELQPVGVVATTHEASGGVRELEQRHA